MDPGSEREAVRIQPTATRLPEALAAIVAVPLLYDVVRRLHGSLAGLVAAAALAVMPISVLTGRSDTMDAVMMLLDVLAAWFVVRGASTRRAWPLVAAGVTMGLAFNVKLFEALIVLPALVVLAVLAGERPLRQRASAFAAASLAFLVTSGAWMVAASIAPLRSRPWPIGSTDGSVWSVVFGYNGVDRIGVKASPAVLRRDPPGLLRFFTTTGHRYALLVGTVLAAALVFGAIALLVARRHSPGEAGSRRLATAGAAFFGTWLLTGIGLLSMMQRLQPRYLEAVTPAIAGVLGAGIARLVARSQRSRPAAIGLAIGAIAVAVLGIQLVQPPTWLWTPCSPELR